MYMYCIDYHSFFFRTLLFSLTTSHCAKTFTRRRASMLLLDRSAEKDTITMTSTAKSRVTLTTTTKLIVWPLMVRWNTCALNYSMYVLHSLYLCIYLYPGTWFTEYAYIDEEEGTEQQCINRNNTNGLRRVWAPKAFGDDPSCLVLPNAPECIQGGWSRDNHLGNGRDGVPLNYTWTLPYFPSGRSKIAILRLRWGLLLYYAFIWAAFGLLLVVLLAVSVGVLVWED